MASALSAVILSASGKRKFLGADNSVARAEDKQMACQCQKYLSEKLSFTGWEYIGNMRGNKAVIGAGMAGLMAGGILSQAGRGADFDKGRRIGGRMASRRDSGLLFNHGAQFVTAHSPVFSPL